MKPAPPFAPSVRTLPALLAAVLFAAWLSGLWAAVSPVGASGPWGGGLRPFAAALALAAVAFRAYWHPYRALGLVPTIASGWCALSLVGLLTGEAAGWAHGLCAGAALGAAASAARTFRPRLWAALAGLVLAAEFAASECLSRETIAPDAARARLAPALLAATAALALFGWLAYFRPWFELLIEPPLWLMYRARAAGPGQRAYPARGPCLVIANHACWLDPIFLCKLLPRPLTPMMTGRFYDLPVMGRLMRTFGVIKVREQAVRREFPPELQEAIAALDRGECVVVFPEGYLRRTEDRPLRRFGQGVWQILKARPSTPVFACWIEGGWGSYTSYFGGKPTRDKKPDRRRPIAVGFSAPVAVDPALLEHNIRTRVHLMNEVVAARKHLGLPELPRYDLPKAGEEEADGQS